MKRSYVIINLLVLTAIYGFDVLAVNVCVTDSVAEIFKKDIARNDTVKEANVTELKEVIVESERLWIEDGKIIGIPTRQEKNFAIDPASLIRNMHLPMLMEVSGNVTTVNGEPVVYYINGKPANNIDLSTFWGKNVKRVEYIANPTDPRMAGARNVVNIIMTEYEVGGVTRLQGIQYIPCVGYYTVASKATYKRMTYGATVTGYYERDHRIYKKGEETFKNYIMREIIMTKSRDNIMNIHHI